MVRATKELFRSAVASPDQLLEGDEITAFHRNDKSHFLPAVADLLILVNTTEEVSNVLKICNQHKITVTPSGTRTGLEGGSLPIFGGVVLHMESMKRVISLLPDEMLVTVQPGITKLQLNAWLKKKGLFFPVDPGSNACIGGYASTNASGMLTLKYGAMRDQVRCMKVVLANGSIIDTRTRAVKSSAGYSLHHLLIGSEGTLAVVCELTLRVLPLPPVVLASSARFAETGPLCKTVTEIIKKGITELARSELLNQTQMIGVNKHMKTSFEEVPTLMLEFHGRTLREVRDAAALVETIAMAHGCREFVSTSDPDEIANMWEARRAAYFAAYMTRPPVKGRTMRIFTTDVCVPITCLAQAIVETEEDFAANSTLQCPIVGHVGDGNYHVLCPYLIDDPNEVAMMTALNDRLVRRALALGGTCTGEHGVGFGKAKFLRQERGSAAVDAMQAIKLALDPNNILNPGKVLPCAESEAIANHPPVAKL